MKQLLPAIAILFCYNLQAQRTVNVETTNDKTLPAGFYYTVNGEPFSPIKYVKVVEGSPYFSDQWMQGEVYFDNGTGYKDLLLKIDLIENEIHFMSSGGEEMIVNTPLKEVVLIDSISGKSYRFVHGAAIGNDAAIVQMGWYQLLQKGNTSLYKLNQKSISESKPYGSATVEQKITTSPSYLLVSPARISRIKKWKELNDALSDKKKQVDQFLTTKKITGKEETDFVTLVEYYNSIQ